METRPYFNGKRIYLLEQMCIESVEACALVFRFLAIDDGLQQLLDQNIFESS